MKGNVNMSRQALSEHGETAATFYRNQHKGVAENRLANTIRLETAERAGQLSLSVLRHANAVEGDQEDLDYFNDEARQHVDEHLDEYIETARREAEAGGIHVDPERPE